MNKRQAPPRAWRIPILLRITILVLFIGFAGLSFWLGIAHHRPWFAAYYLYLSIIFIACGIFYIACGLFYNSWFAAKMGVQNYLRFGPTRARITYIVGGLLFLIMALILFVAPALGTIQVELGLLLLIMGIARIGPTRTRIVYIVGGLLLLIAGLVRFLLH